MTERAQLLVEYPSPWFEFPLDPDVDPDRWADAKAEELVLAAGGEDVPEITRILRPDAAALAAELRSRVSEYRRSAPSHALGCYPPGVDTSDVGMEISWWDPDEEGSRVTDSSLLDAEGLVDLDRFVDRVVVHELGDPLVEKDEVGTGPVVRIRQNYPGKRRSWFGGRPVIRALTHAIRPRGMTALVVANTLWTDAGLDEYIEPWADGIVGTIRVVPA
ncbi:hypothetical protein [Streptomyces alkaliphilus]|uniref:hypothetical protein n=1 Tax=Streptomyces alkaliphilus TaxID=1472722 RepID=UPI00117FA5ED|nr:hypothetical protein [Streptomyces alkaliphilus]MQS06303.1 hypothetical protein [Streptomyces alkaliphilus]